MVPLDAEKVLSIPRKIRCQEVVRRGFMSDYLFQNISNIFHAPQAVINIITAFQPIAEPKAKVEMTSHMAEAYDIDENGEVNISQETILNKQKEIFG